MNTNVAPTALRPIGQYVNARVSVRSSDFGNFPKAIASFGNYLYECCLSLVLAEGLWLPPAYDEDPEFLLPIIWTHALNPRVSSPVG